MRPDSPGQVLRRHGLRPKKSWGQCFLHDPGVLSRIVEAAEVGPADTVVEIGAGLGTLTTLLAQRARRVLAVERDRELAQVLRQELAARPEVQVCEANALTFDLRQPEGPVLVVGNLPYNISAPLLFRLMEERAAVRRATVMVQREVAERLVASPGTKEYGVPSVLLQQLAEVRLCFGVAAGAFVPRPRVESAVVRIDFLAEPRAPAPTEIFDQVVRAAFSQRRKTLRRALAARFDEEALGRALLGAGLDGRRRGETLTVEEFAGLARALVGGGEGA